MVRRPPWPELIGRSGGRVRLIVYLRGHHALGFLGEPAPARGSGHSAAAHEESTMYNPIGVRQLNAFAARAMLRLPDVRELDGPTGPAAHPTRPPVDDETPPAPIEP